VPPDLNLFSAIYDAIFFLTRKMGIPKMVVMEAADAARRVIHNHIQGKNNERRQAVENPRVS